MILLVVQCVVAGLIVLGLYHFGRSLGLLLLVVYVAAIQLLQNLLAENVFLELLDGVVVSPGSAVLFSSTFLVLLLVTIREGLPATRRILCAILAANLFLTLIVGGSRLAAAAGYLIAEPAHWLVSFSIPIYLIGTGLLILDALLLIVLERALAGLGLPQPARLIASLVVVLSFDSIVFVLSAADLPATLLPGQLIGKSVAGVIYGALLAVYLRVTAPPAWEGRPPAGERFAWLQVFPLAKRRKELSRSVLLVLPAAVLAGVASTALIFALSRKVEDDRLMSDFRRDSEERFSAIEAGLAQNLSSLVALESLYALLPQVDRAAFGGFARHLLQHDMTIRAVEWIPRVPSEERQRFEASVRREGNPGFQITEVGPRGQLVRAGDRPVYFPVTFVEPLAGNEKAIGYDLASEPTRLAALERAHASEDLVASAFVRLVQTSGEEPGFLVYSPVFSADPNTPDGKQLRGFLGGVFLAGRVVEAALTPLEARGIDLAVYDVSETDRETLLYFHRSRQRPPTAVVEASVQELHDEFRLQSEDVVIADHRWRIVATPTDAYLAAGRSWLPWGFLLAGLLLTGVFAVYLALLARSSDEAQRLTQQIEQSEERYRGLADASFDGVATSENGIIVDASQAFADTFGYRVEELRGMPVTELVDPEYRSDVREKIASQYETPYESLCVRKDGTRFPVEVCGRAVPYGGRMARVAAVREISERKQAEAELRALERRYRGLFQDAPEMYVLTEATAGGPVISECNESFLRTLGYSREEVVGRPLADFYSEDSRRQMLDQGDYRKALRGEFSQRERSLITRSGEIVHTVLRAAPEVGAEGGVVGTRAIYVDITERTQIETLVRQSREKLRRLAERLHTVREEERKSLARQMHDELGQSLTALRIDLSWMQSKVEGENPLAERVATMIGLIDRLIDTVRDLSARLRPHVLDTLGLAAAIEWEAEQFQRRSGMPCTFGTNSDEDEVDRGLDADRTTAIFRIFQEALTNVARHAKATAVQVSLCRTASGLELEVLDDGRGIGDEEISSIRSIGLIGMRERVGALAGTLDISRRPEGGTRLWVRIPP